jgi:DNA polymerase III epsilon subunit-like protein
MTDIVLFDLEFTTWEGTWQRGWTGENEHREVVQIGALKIDWPSGKILTEMNQLVKPTVNPQLSDYFQQLTHITQAQVNAKGIAYADALQRFLDLCGSLPTGSYGNDNHVFVENSLLLNLRVDPLDGISFINIRPMIEKADPACRVNSGRLWQHFNLPKPAEADEHDAIFDCYSIRAALLHLHAQGHTLPF